MTARDAIERLRGLGVELTPRSEADRIRWRATGPVPPEVRGLIDALLDELRRQKPEALALLRAEGLSSLSSHPEDTRPRRLVAIEYDPETRLTTRFFSDGPQDTPGAP